jgi:hypothetical protein
MFWVMHASLGCEGSHLKVSISPFFSLFINWFLFLPKRATGLATETCFTFSLIECSSSPFTFDKVCNGMICFALVSCNWPCNWQVLHFSWLCCVRCSFAHLPTFWKRLQLHSLILSFCCSLCLFVHVSQKSFHLQSHDCSWLTQKPEHATWFATGLAQFAV